MLHFPNLFLDAMRRGFLAIQYLIVIMNSDFTCILVQNSNLSRGFPTGF